MPRVLFLLTHKDEPLAAEMLRQLAQQPDCQLEVVDLTLPEVDYDALLEKIFSADSVQSW
jgi:hypothetical protein